MSDLQVENPTVGETLQPQAENPPEPQVGERLQPQVAETTQLEESKLSIRKKIWEQFSSNKLVAYPRPYGRVPNFKDAELACAKLLDLDVFHNAKSVEVGPEKVLASVRMLVLEKGKDLYVPCPGLEQGLTRKLELNGEHNIKDAVTRRGMESLGKRVEMKGDLKIDLIVLGSVAVSEEGYRIGAGQGYADLEFALLKEMRAVDDNVVVVTIVHDLQVLDLPKDIFKKYDVPVDYILTPTRTIRVEHRLTKPEGIFWNELTERRLKHRPTLQDLKVKHESEGKDTTLRIETPEELRIKNPYPRPTRFFRRKPKPRSASDRATSENMKRKWMPRKRIPSRIMPAEIVEAVANRESAENAENTPPQKKFKKKKKQQIEYSLRVGNIEKTVRVRDLKNALREKGIKPSNISWKGSRGYCLLHYSKKNRRLQVRAEGGETEEGSEAINSVIVKIQELKINPDSEMNLSVKVLEPITRIETVDVTAV